jgi:2-amino-4-hydroxy-6-hydroxymethyldihydropteridine diphosphokinase
MQHVTDPRFKQPPPTDPWKRNHRPARFAPALLRCGIALGGNEGDRLAMMQLAHRAVTYWADFSGKILTSSLYETDPVGCASGTAAFYNAVMEMTFYGEAFGLLDELQQLEERVFQRPAVREANSPRRMDLDLLYIDHQTLQTPELILPHPRLTERRFVLEPLAEIRPELILPGQTQSIAALAAALVTSEPPLRLISSPEWARRG